MSSIVYAGGSDRGKVRQQNEDSILCCDFEDADVKLFIVADGVGGHSGGEVASKLAVDSIKSNVEKFILQARSGGGYSDKWLDKIVLSSVEQANKIICSQQKEHDEISNMATTLVVVLIYQSTLVLSYLGDSRCYQLSDNNLLQITEDHTVPQTLLNEGKVTQKEFEAMPMHNVITQALGLVDGPDVKLFHYDLKQNDLYLLCSDGLTDCVSDSQIQQTIIENENLSDCVDKLITSANDNGGTDNVSLILLRQE